MLKAIPKNMLSWSFAVVDGNRHVSDLDFSWWRERGQIVVDGEPFDVYREKVMGGAFVLERNGSVVARAEKPSAFARKFQIEHGGKRYTLKAASMIRREFRLSEGTKRLGSIAPAGLISRRARVTFSEAIPLPVRVFMIWFALLLWRRQHNSAAGS